MRVFRSALMFGVMAGLLGVAGSLPSGLARADEEQAAHDAVDEAHGGEPGHGEVSLREILFGHEKWQFWGSIVNFGLLVYLIRRMAKKPTQDFLQNRKHTIERGIEEAAQVKAKAEAVHREYTDRLRTLDQELIKLRADITESAAQDRARIVADAEVAAQRVKAETEALVLRQAEQLEHDIRREVVAAAVAAAGRAVREVATAEDQRRLAETFARELAQVNVEKRA